MPCGAMRCGEAACACAGGCGARSAAADDTQTPSSRYRMEVLYWYSEIVPALVVAYGEAAVHRMRATPPPI